jgi:TolB-like protein/tetratricopeptide (TPR) repeat protein/tRNA A-37 threonylcarbamoyl transferase component Bud32
MVTGSSSDTLPRLQTALAGRYTLGQEIGRGGMATVYRAHDLKHDRRVAVKVLVPEVAASLGSDRFLQEIKFVAGLNHPHILPLHDSGEADGFLYYVMPYVEGETLRERLKREKQASVEETLALAESVAGALDHAHRHGVIHRDVKPENILLQEGQAVVTDFGVARPLTRTAAESRTEAGIAVGTPEYMSPEACTGDRDLDGRSDEYALACVLYEMLAGHPPFTAPVPQAVAARHVSDAVPPLATVRPDIPANMSRAIMTALAKDPNGRYPSLHAFAEALRTASADQEQAAARSVAVLPFANLGGGPDEEFLSDGITDEIIMALTRIEGLRVVSRTSTFAYKRTKQDVRAIGRQLHVRSVLEGGVQRKGESLRVSVRLVGVADGYLLWSERFDREMRDVFAIQDEISQNVARALRVILTDDERRALARVPTRDVEAYEAYLRGRSFFRQTRRKSLQYAQEMFERAIALDPAFALAWAGAADCCSLLNMYFPYSETDLSPADQASARALALDSGLPEAHAARGFALWRMQRADEAVVEFENAMRLDGKQFEARYFYARLCYQRGDAEHAAELFEDAARAREDYQARFFAAQSYATLGRKAEAEAAYRRALHVVQQHLALNPDDPRAATMCAVSLCRLGDREEGLRWAERARAIDPDDPGVLYNVACLYALEGKADDAISCLGQAFQAGFGAREWIAQDPDLESLRGDPRFQALVASPSRQGVQGR